MRKNLLLLLIVIPAILWSQTSLPGKFFIGYEKSVKGGGFQYHSPQPDVTSSLLLRSIDSMQYIEWETESIPAATEGPTVNLIWMFGIDANLDSHTFTLYVNGKFIHLPDDARFRGFPVKAAMHSDINGAPWCLTDYLPGAGIEYLNMAQNTHRADKPFDRPTTFWWESPSGNRLLVNRPEHYMWANSLGILTNGETFGKGLFHHLLDITGKEYPFDRYAIQFSGYLTE